jgi:spore photoproduct lyase
LEAYLGTEALVLFANVEKGLWELKKVLATLKTPLNADPENFQKAIPDKYPRSYRFCTGEFTDSLLFDNETRLSEKLILLFAESYPATLELKTKTANVDHLLPLKHNGRTVISFSINAPIIARLEEPHAAPLKARFEAASKVAAAGYKVGFHFDPICYFPGWEKSYAECVNMLFSALAPSSLAWISLGCFRYLPKLKPIMLKKTKGTLFNSEFILGADGKARYPRPLRYLLYRTLLDLLTPHLSPQTVVYLCMESGRIWSDLFGYDPGTEGLTAMFQRPF